MTARFESWSMRPRLTKPTERNKDMNTDSRTRIECTDWDEEVPVATWTKGCGRKPARKVLTKGVAKVELTKAQTERIAKMLGSGMEVRLAVGGEDAVRLYPCAATDFKTMFVAAETIGEFRHAAYRGRHLSFTSRNGARNVGEDEIEERVSRACRTGGNRAHVSPEKLVRCPKCGFEFKVGKSLS